MTIDEARAKAHQQYDDCMFCPGCSGFLTGGNEEPIIIGLAIAVVIGIGIVCLMDALKNKLK